MGQSSSRRRPSPLIHVLAAAALLSGACGADPSSAGRITVSTPHSLEKQPAPAGGAAEQTPPPPGTPAPAMQETEAPAAQEPNRFSWVEDQVVAGLAHPGHGASADASLAWLSAHGVRVLVSLTEEPVPAAQVAAAGLEALHIPVVDFTAPTQEQLDLFIDSAATARDAGKPVAVHCAGGMGRTGTFLATWLVANEGLSAADAIARIRELRPGSVETAAQEAAITTWAERHPAP